MVNDLKARGLWDEVMINDLKYYDGSVQPIDRVPDDLKAKYATAFEVEPKWLVEAASRRQKWIDQAISRNMYLETRDLGDMMDIYFGAWERGVKTTYYLHMKPRHTAEQSTVKVNKSVQVDEGAPAKRGFGAASAPAEPAS